MSFWYLFKKNLNISIPCLIYYSLANTIYTISKIYYDFELNFFRSINKIRNYKMDQGR